MIHDKIPLLLHELGAKIGYYAAIFKTKAGKNTCLLLPITPIHLGQQHLPQSWNLIPDLTESLMLLGWGGTGSPSDPQFQRDELFSKCGPLLFTSSGCFSEGILARPILRPKRSSWRLDGAAPPLYQSASGLSTRPSA